MDDITCFNLNRFGFSHKRRLSAVNAVYFVFSVSVHRVLVAWFKPHYLKAKRLFTNRFFAILFSISKLVCHVTNVEFIHDSDYDPSTYMCFACNQERVKSE